MKLKSVLVLPILLFILLAANAQQHFNVIAFYTGKHDLAHISFVHEANRWFPEMGKKYHFTYDSTNNWDNMNDTFLAKYQVILFLDTRPDVPAQREAFQRFIERGGGWMGFHFSAFALTPSDYPQNWNWYHNIFLGAGSYVSNTWHPTAAVVRVESQHPVTKGLPHLFSTAPNEWYRWSGDVAHNPDIQVLLAIDSSSFPLGTGPKQHEIWHSGYYPVVWTNKKYKMVYMNIGHNDMDYDGGTNRELSQTLNNAFVDKMVINALLWLSK